MVLLGSTRSKKLVAKIRGNGWGRLFCGRATPLPGEPWALDNGAFSAWRSGKAWDEAAFLRSVDRAMDLHPPLFGVLPDIVAGGDRSLSHSLEWARRLPGRWPWYLAVQDGMTLESVGRVLPRVDGIFLGGTDAFKRTARSWCHLAHDNGKGFHFARVSTEARYRAAYEMGADSCDTSQPLWSDVEWARFERWWRDTERQERLFA
jgi:hypothetical protein